MVYNYSVKKKGNNICFPHCKLPCVFLCFFFHGNGNKGAISAEYVACCSFCMPWLHEDKQIIRVALVFVLALDVFHTDYSPVPAYLLHGRCCICLYYIDIRQCLRLSQLSLLFVFRHPSLVSQYDTKRFALSYFFFWYYVFVSCSVLYYRSCLISITIVSWLCSSDSIWLTFIISSFVLILSAEVYILWQNGFGYHYFIIDACCRLVSTHIWGHLLQAMSSKCLQFLIFYIK